jgi:regulatory protein
MTNNEQAIIRLKKYCAYRERCHQEVRQKLESLNCKGDDAEEVMALLISENYLNEERYAKEFAWGKFNNNAWGRRKIKQHLKLKDISEYCIQKGLSEIDDETYKRGLRNMLEKRLAHLPDKHPNIARPILFNFAHNKGFENYLVVQCLNDLLGSHDPGSI